MARPDSIEHKPKRVCPTKGCNTKISNDKYSIGSKKHGQYKWTKCAGCIRRAGESVIPKSLPKHFKKMNEDWRDIVRDSKDDDTLLRRRVQMYYDNLRIGQFIHNIRIDKKTKTIRIKIPRNKADLFIGRRSSIKSNLERLVKHTVEIIA
jgi:hypothetical protein